MADFPTRQDLFRVARDEVLRLNGELTRDVVEREGSDANILANLSTAGANEVISQLMRICAAQYLGSAKGGDLDRLVFDRYGMLRKAASPSLGTAVFFTTAVTASAFTIPADVTVSSVDGTKFLTTLATSFPAGSIGPVYVPIRSILAGADQNASIGSITSIISTIPGAPTDLEVTNTVATAGASAEESDDALTDRARRFFTTAQRGTIGALENAALAISGVNKATAIESLDALGRPARFVQLIIADRFTDALANLGTADPSYDAQSQQLAQQVYLGLNEFRAGGIFVHVIVGQVILQALQLQLTFSAGVDADTVALKARAALVSYINNLSPGATFVPDNAITAALKPVTGLIITGDEIVTPAGSVVPKATQVLRTSLELVTAVAVQTSQPVALTTNPDAFAAGGVTSF